MKVAIVYDRVNKWGGAERLLLALHKLFPDAPLYTSVYNERTAPWAEVFNGQNPSIRCHSEFISESRNKFGAASKMLKQVQHDKRCVTSGIKTSFLQNFSLASSAHELYALLMPIAFESFSFDEYDLVISVTSEAAKGIITKPKTLHICYCLTPIRYLWSGYDEYFKNPIFRFLSKPTVSYLRALDKVASQRPNMYVAISKEVQGRIKKYYGRESVVVYPPIGFDARNWKLEARPLKLENRSSINSQTSNIKNPASSFKRQASNYFLIVSRLVPYKKIDLAIRAFNKLKLPLKIVGAGSQEAYLKSISGPTIEFLGHLTEQELVRYYKDCLALIFPGIEDFGLTILEAQDFGKPVIAFRGGGQLETIIEGKTGLFFDYQTVDSLIKAIKQFSNVTINPKDCIRNAERFSFERFKKEFLSVMLNSFNCHPELVSGSRSSGFEMPKRVRHDKKASSG